MASMILVFINHRTRLEQERQTELKIINQKLRDSEATLEKRVIERTQQLRQAKEEAETANKAQLNFMGYNMMGRGKNDLALRFFKLNNEKHPDDPNTFDSLGEYYKTVGENKLAIKALKKSLSMDPPANVKANSIKLLKEMGVDTSEYEKGS